MKMFVLALFAASLYLLTQRADHLSLAYFSFFPLGFLFLIYFYEARYYFFPALALFILASVFRFPVSHHPEAALLAAGTLAAGGLLAYCRRTWQRRVKAEEALWNEARRELEELRHKRQVRLESLRHLEKQVASLINLFEIARDFNECLDFKETAQILHKKVMPEVPFEQAELLLLTPAPPFGIAKAFVISRLGVEEKPGFGEGSLEAEWVQKAIGEKGMVMADGAGIFPLVPEGEPTALFAIQGFEKEDLAKFEVLASQLSLQVRKIRLYEMVRELSIIDGLTGVFVRRHFLERFEEELRRALKHNFPLAVLMLDIDHFKRYNDDFGHLVGDVTLKEVAGVIRASVRNVDIVARYGGEEFVVVVPETRQAGAQEAAERIRSAVARRSFRGFDEETKATVSIGVSVFPDDVSDSVKGEYDGNLLFELLQHADRALYGAKQEGRNRVVLYHSLKQA